MDKIIDRIIEKMKVSDSLTDDEEIVRYGLEIMITKMIFAVSIVIVGLLMKSFFEGAVFTVAYCLIRQYGGGSPAKTRIGCYIRSMLTFVAALVIIQAVGYLPALAVTLSVLSVISVVYIFFAAPIDSENKRLDNDEISEFVKERGLGTPATRAAIIEELIAAGYIERKKKQLVSTEYGRKFAASLPENVKSAELTARWEQALSDIENGSGNADDLLSEIVKSVSDIVSLERSRGSREAISRTKTVGTCPRCGKPVIENSKGFSCSAGREKCGFFIFKLDKRIGRNYTAAEISELLSSGRVTLKNCVSSNGNKYSAVFSMDDAGTYVNLRFERFADGIK